MNRVQSDSFPSPREGRRCPKREKESLGYCVNLRSLIIFGLLLFFLITRSANANTFYPFDTPKQDAQFSHLLRSLRCLVCQNQDLADSNAGLANDLRDEVYTLVKEGQTDDEIIHYLTARYGDFILFKPPVKAITAMLWFGPALFMVLGLLIFWRTCLRRQHDK